MIARTALLAAILLAGCNRPGPMTGGPCAYETIEFAATVMGHDGEDVTLVGPGGDPFTIPAKAFRTLPAVGENIQVEKDSIIKGTCTPYMFRPAG